MLTNSTVPVLAGAITETWWKDDFSDAQVTIPGFSLVRCDRPERRGGGCALYINDKVTPTDEYTWGDTSSNIAAAYLAETHVVLVAIYRAPGARLSSILHRVQSFIDKHSSENVVPDIHILGDLNCPGIDWKTCSSSDGQEIELLEFADKFFLTQVVQKPTRGDNTLDIVLTNREEYFAAVETEELQISDHLAVHCTLGFGLNQVSVEKNGVRRGFQALDIHHADFDAIAEKLKEVDWDSILGDYSSDGDGSDLVELLSGTVLKITSQFTRAKRRGTARRDPMLKRLRKKQKKLNQRIRAAKASNSFSGHVDKLERKVAKVALEIRNYLNERLEQDERRAVEVIRTNPKFFWTYTNDRRKMRSRFPPLMRSDGSLATAPSEKAELFQDQYASVFSDPNSVCVEEAVGDISYTGPSLSSITFTPESIEAALKELNPYSAGPPDDIPACILHRCRSALAYPLFLLWRGSYERGVVPSCLKRQYITPIFKKGSRSEAANYRPVALTSNIIKCFERVVRAELVGHLESSGVLNSSQHGFRKNRSCLTQLIDHLDSVLRSLNDGDEVDVIYLDFQKAFDKVDLNILMAKLEKYGVTGKLLSWISSFLCGRVQTVGVDLSLSSFRKVLSGVPQGSVLGPVLFLIYVIDLECSLTFSDSLSFADDTKISNAIRTIMDQANLQADLCSVVRWAEVNNMVLHDEKFELLSYTLRSSEPLRQLPFTAGYYSYQTPGGVSLEPSVSVRDLGVILSADGSWKEQIAKVSAAASKVANWILGTFKCRSADTLLTLYKTLVRPILEYCSAVWSPTLVGEIAQLEQVQRNFTRRILGCQKLGYWERLAVLNLQSLQRRRERYAVIHMWKIYNGLVPNGIGLEFTETSRHGPRAILPGFNYRAQRAISSQYENSFSVRGPMLWNTLPRNVKESGSINELKATLGEHLKSFPDRPPTRGYTGINGNSLLDFAICRGAGEMN